MRILFFTQIVPFPLDAGPKTRAYHVLQYLAQAGHDISLVAFRREDDAYENIAHLQTFCREVHTILMRRSPTQDLWHLARSVFREEPFLIARDQRPEMIRTVERLLRHLSFDAIHADQLWMAQYALAAHALTPREHRPKLILDQHNATYLIPQRLARSENNPLKRTLLNRESQRMAHYEAKICRQFDHVVWVTCEDKTAVEHVQSRDDATRLSSPQPVHAVIPICVDPATKPAVIRVPGAHRVTFLGGLHWPPNAEGMRWFLSNVWPAVLRATPHAVLTIIGKDSGPALSRLAQRSQNVEVLGYVDDLIPYLSETAAFIVPLASGGGMRVKIVDGWSWGLPIVSTSIGAEGVLHKHGKNILIADDECEFANAVCSLLQQPHLARRLSEQGRQTVLNDYNWKTVYRAWDDVYESRL